MLAKVFNSLKVHVVFERHKVVLLLLDGGSLRAFILLEDFRLGGRFDCMHPIVVVVV